MSAASAAGMAAAGPQIKNEYAGFTLPSAEYKLDEVAVDRLGSKWFWENYRTVYTDYPWVDISGTKNPTKFIGDIALNNMMGLNNCPGQEFQMIDVDPMGFVRRCPENPIAYNADRISDVTSYLKEGSPCRKEKCNCITG